MAAPTIAGQSAESPTTGTTISYAIPACQTGDILVVAVGRGANYLNDCTVSDSTYGETWTRKINLDCDGGTGNLRVGIELWWARATSTRASYNIQVTQTANYEVVLVAWAIRGGAPSGDPFSGTPGTACANGGAAATLTIPAVTTADADCLVFHAAMTRSPAGLTGIPDLSNWTNTGGALASFAQNWNAGTTSGTDRAFGGTKGTLAAAGSSGTVTVDVDEDYYAALASWAFKPGALATRGLIVGSMSLG